MYNVVLLCLLTSIIGSVIYYVFYIITIEPMIIKIFFIIVKKGLNFEIEEPWNKNKRLFRTRIISIYRYSHRFEYHRESFKYRMAKTKIENKLFFNKFSERRKNDIIYELIEEKSQSDKKVMLYINIVSSIFYGMYFFSIITNKDIIYIILDLMIWLICIKQIILIYRYKNMYFGTCYVEAKEVISFIKKSQNGNNDLSGGKSIFNNEIEQMSVKNVQTEYT